MGQYIFFALVKDGEVLIHYKSGLLIFHIIQTLNGIIKMDMTKAELVRRIDRLRFENKNLIIENRLLRDKFVIRSFISEVFKRLFMR